MPKILVTGGAGFIGSHVVVEVSPDMVPVPARHEVLYAYSSHEKIRRVFGRLGTTTLEEGLKSMAAWVKRYGARASKEFERIGVVKNLPAAWLR